MHTLIIVLTVLVAILLIAVVLIQKSKGGGLSSSFAGGNQVLGVRHTNDFIEKATWTLAGIICVLSIISTRISPSSVEQTELRTKSVTAPVNAAPATPVQAAPVQVPAAETTAAPAQETAE